MTRKRLRVWIERVQSDGHRVSIESIELDKSESKRLLRWLQEQIDV